MQIPVLSGVFTDEDSDYRIAYPRNLVPVPLQQGVSNGYLRPADGIIPFDGSYPGTSRGAIRWNDICYRVMGTKLLSIASDGSPSVIGDVGSGGQVSMNYSFDRLAVSSGGRFYYWDGTTFSQVTDPDLGTVVDFIWADGYFMTTDGTNLVVTELTDPFAVNPLKYGSSEADPDPVKAILKLGNEPYALNRFTIEAFDNIGGDLFPFQRIDGAQINRGVVGTHACCIFLDSIAFVGGGKEESIAVWLGANGSSVKISTREVDTLLGEYTEAQLSQITVESRTDKGHRHLLIHLPNQTLVYDGAASQILGDQIWFTLASTLVGDGRYYAKDLVRCYDTWLVGHPAESKLGYLSNEVGSHWGNHIGWEFSTLIIYNESRGAIIHSLELAGLTGRAVLGDDPTISTRYSIDGETWSQERFISAGKQGERNKRLIWLQQGNMRTQRIQQFRGTTKSRLSVARLEAQIEPLVV